MVLFLYYTIKMKKFLLPLFLIAAGTIVLTSCIGISSTSQFAENSQVLPHDTHRIVYFNPEVYPDVEEIKFLSYQAFFDGVTEKLGKFKHLKITRVETPLAYDSIDVETIKEICLHNDSDLAVVPKIKYFKVGLGKYVFSNQVVISMKMFDSKGNLITETSYDTYRKNKRMLGSTTNSIKIGTEGAMNDIIKEIRLLNRHSEIETPTTETRELITFP